MADDFRPGEEDRVLDTSNPVKERYGRRGRRIMTALVAVAAVLGFGVVLVYAYNKGKQDAGSGAAPIIQAQDGLTKTRPESPGGMNVPDRDKEIFNRLETRQPADKVERLLPPPEKPMDRPPPAEMPKMPEPSAGSAGTMAQGAPDTMPAPPPPPPTAATAAVPPPPPPPPVASPPAALSAAPSSAPSAASVPKAPAVEAPKKTAPAPAAKKPASVAAKSPAPKPAATGRWKIQLSSLRSEAAARKTWASAQSKNRDLLGKLSLSVQRVDLTGGKGTYYRVQAGPLASRAAAGSLCTRLKARKLSCIVVRP